ncbi:MAG: cell division protein ZapA [Proteobacteria bacterium]|nr:cell division protein ZapA [Pseudomonadota bacterium]
MSGEQNNTVVVRILDKQYEVRCSSDQELDLHQAARFLDSKMQQIRHNGKLKSAEQIAIMAALNVSHELLIQQKQKDQYIHAMSKQIKVLNSKIDASLAKQEEIEL